MIGDRLRSVPPEVAHRWLADGHWSDDTLGALLERGLTAHSRQVFSVRSAVRPWRGTFADVASLARRVAGGLRARGVGAGDPVAFQLPNWLEAAATFYGAAFIGAVVVPIVHFYGPKEVGYILRRTGVKALITTDRFGHLDYLAMFDQLRPGLRDLELVAIVGNAAPSGTITFADLASGPPVGGAVPGDPDEPALVAYTSGTTADPKGVIHTHRTIGFEIRQLSAVQPAAAPPTLVGAPVGHGIGMLAALLLPVQLGKPIHLIDVWDPRAVLAAMAEDRLLAGTGATYFLTSLLDHPDLTPAHLELMSHIGLGGSTVPAAVTERATSLGISVVRLYGSTEHPSITGCTHDEPLAKRVRTDGRPLPGCEIRLVDDSGADVAPGVTGEILSRGPDCFVGYTDPRLTAAAFDADGWYRTEDVGVLDDDGFLAIVDRKKDIIIRGGENISALEVEEQLLRLSGVAEAIVIAVPDARLGEHACALVRLQPGADAPTLDEVRRRMAGAGLARPKWPEELRVVDDFPRTPSGKVQKFLLRQQAAGRLGALAARRGAVATGGGGGSPCRR